jgi:hypothetical protein
MLGGGDVARLEQQRLELLRFARLGYELDGAERARMARSSSLPPASRRRTR